MEKQKRAKRLLKQYGKHIKASEEKQGNCMSLALYGYVDYKHLQEVAKGGEY